MIIILAAVTAMAALLAFCTAAAVKSRKKLNKKRESLVSLYADMLHALDQMPEYGPSDTAAFLLGRDTEGANGEEAQKMLREKEEEIKKQMAAEKEMEDRELKKAEKEEKKEIPRKIWHSIHAEKRHALTVRLTALENGERDIADDLRQAGRCIASFMAALEKAKPAMAEQTAEAADQALKTAYNVFEKGDYANRDRDQTRNRIREKKEELEEAMCIELRLDDISEAAGKRK